MSGYVCHGPECIFRFELALAALALLLLPQAFLRQDGGWLAGLMLVLFWADLGIVLAAREYRSVHVDWPADSGEWHCRLLDYPQEKNASRLLKLKIIPDGGNYEFEGKVVWAYVPKDSASALLNPGDRLVFRGRPESPVTDWDKLDFDYAAYLYNKGVSGTLYIPARNWIRSGQPARLTLKDRALRLRRRLLDRYGEWGFSEKALGVVSALTVGSKDALPDELKEHFRVSGASHVLAVSGLHVGIMYAFLVFLFPPFMNVGRWRWLREASVLTILWSYSFIIGMPLSIVRSLVMFTLLSLGRLLERDGASLNSLAVAAVAILAFNPYGIYDAGFQLSFAAVLFILLLQPYISKILHPKTAAGKYVWDILSVSLAAQAGTLPLTLMLFGGFPAWFLLTNLMVIPLTFVMVCTALVLLMLCWIPLARMVLVGVLNSLVWTVDALLGWIANLPGAHLDMSVSSWMTVALMYGILLMLYEWLSTRRTRGLVAASSLVAIWSTAGLIVLLLK